MVQCSQCGKLFDREEGGRSVASICGGIMGDEYIESYYLCDRCGVYTVEIVHDHFLGDEEVFVRGPMTRTEGDEKVQLIRQCSEPWNKKCRCPAHMTYFEGNLD